MHIWNGRKTQEEKCVFKVCHWYAITMDGVAFGY